MNKARNASRRTSRKRAASARRWQNRVSAAATQLVRQIERLERSAPGGRDMSGWLSTLNDLSGRLNRILGRYGSTFL